MRFYTRHARHPKCDGGPCIVCKTHVDCGGGLVREQEHDGPPTGYRPVCVSTPLLCDDCRMDKQDADPDGDDPHPLG